MITKEIITAIAVGGPFLMALIAGYDLWCLVTAKATPGQVIQWWAEDHPILAGFFTLFVGAFLAHIFWHL